MRQTPKFSRFKNVLQVLPLSLWQVWRGSDFTRRRGGQNVEFFICLFVALLNVRDCVPGFAMKALEYKNILMPFDSGRFCSCAQCSTFSDRRQLATPQNAEIQKSKMGPFAAKGRHNKSIETKFDT